MGTKQRGRMPEPGYTILQKNCEYLLSDIHKASHLTSCLFSNLIIDGDDKYVIENAEKQHGRKAGVSKLIDILLFSGQGAYSGFIKCLREKGYDIVADTLERTTVTPPINPYTWIEELPAERQNKHLKDKDVMILAGYFLSGWESVMIALGNNRASIDHSKADNQFNTQMQIFSQLSRWRQRVASGATLRVLLNAMKTNPQCVDWDQIRKYATDA